MGLLWCLHYADHCHLAACLGMLYHVHKLLAGVHSAEQHMLVSCPCVCCDLTSTLLLALLAGSAHECWILGQVLCPAATLKLTLFAGSAHESIHASQGCQPG